MADVSPVETWSRDYVTFMRCDAGDRWLSDVERQLASWLREKSIDIDVTDDSDLVTGNAKVAVRRYAEGGVKSLQVTLKETTPVGDWTTHLLAHGEPGGRDWIHLAVRNSQGRFADVPRLAKYLMQVLSLGDGSLELVDRVRVFRDEDVADLVALLEDSERHGLVFVAATADDEAMPFDRFVNKVHEWTRQVYGLAQVVVLDPMATASFERAVGQRFAVPPWTLRTFKPGVTFGDDRDARRHRILGTQRLGTHPDSRIRLLLGDIARNHAADRGVPPEVQRLRRRFDRLENRRLLVELQEPEQSAAIQPELPSEGAAAGPEDKHATKVSRGRRDHKKLLGLVGRLLGIEEITPKTLHDAIARLRSRTPEREAIAKFEARIDSLQESIERLEDERAELSEALEEAQMERELALLDIDDRDARLRWLESRLRDRGEFDGAHGSVPDEFATDRPRTYDELLDRIEAIEGVEFTGDASEVQLLSAIDSNESALRTAWDAVLMLRDYARARREGVCAQGLHHYIENTPAGFAGISPGKWAQRETAATMQAYGDERQLPVPEWKDPSRVAEMQAHFKLARIGMKSPRMYLLDCHPAHPVVLIGYIGPHMTNTQTN